jgi:hypothetical protein
VATAKKGAIDPAADAFGLCCVPPVQWTARYEQLREQALEQGCGGRGWGLTLFLRRGMVAWMHAWPQTSSAKPPREQATREDPEEKRPLSAELRDEVVSVWVDMVLHKQEEVFA